MKNKGIINYLVRLREKPIIGKFAFYLLKLIGLEIPTSVSIGKDVSFPHWAYGLVIHPYTVIEDNVKIYQGVTIGRADIYNEYSHSLMDGVIIKKGAILCAGSKILCKEGTLVIGENTIIAANSVILKSTGDNEIWAGIPARKIKDR